MDPVIDPNPTPAGDGKGTPAPEEGSKWKAELTPELQSHPAFANYATKRDQYEGHAKLYTEKTELEGKLSNAILKPGEKATDEEKSNYRQSLFKELGVPDKPEDYQFTKPTIPEGMPYDDSVEAWFKAMLHENHVPNAEADKIFNGYMSMTGKYFQEASKLQKDATDAKVADVKKVWGNDAPLNQDLATRAVYALANLHKDIPGYADWITKAAFEKNPFIYVMLADIGKANQNAPFIQGTGSGESKKGGFEYPNTPKI